MYRYIRIYIYLLNYIFVVYVFNTVFIMFRFHCCRYVGRRHGTVCRNTVIWCRA